MPRRGGGLLATWHRFPAVTARFEIRYRRPAPIDRPLRVASWITGSRGRRIDVRAELRGDGVLLADAAGAFLHVPLDHFLGTVQGRAAADAWRDRLGRG